MTAWIVRDALDDDRDRLVEMTAALQAFERTFEPNRLPPAEMAEPHWRALERWSSRTGGGVLVAAAPGAAPFAFAVWGVDEEFGCFVRAENQRFAVISDLYVDDARRGQGVAAALIAEAEARASEAGLRRIEITAAAGNVGARAAYRAVGFAEDSVTFAKPLTRR